MLYRRTPRNPPTLLLRIVATAGAGTLIGVASCGGETTTANGSVAYVPATQTPEPQGDDSGVIVVGSTGLPCGEGDRAGGPQPFCGVVTGSVAGPPEDAGEPVGVVPCSGSCGGLLGSVAYPDAEAPIDGSVDVPDASVADAELVGSLPVFVDAGYDAHRPIGAVVEPPDADKTTCPPVCGVIIGLFPNPGH